VRLEPELSVVPPGNLHLKSCKKVLFGGCSFAVVSRPQIICGGLSQFQMLHQADILGWGIHGRQHLRLEFDS